MPSLPLQWRRNPGLRECWHHGQSAQADDLQRKGGGALWQEYAELKNRMIANDCKGREAKAIPVK